MTIVDVGSFKHIMFCHIFVRYIRMASGCVGYGGLFPLLSNPVGLLSTYIFSVLIIIDRFKRLSDTDQCTISYGFLKDSLVFICVICLTFEHMFESTLFCSIAIVLMAMLLGLCLFRSRFNIIASPPTVPLVRHNTYGYYVYDGLKYEIKKCMDEFVCATDNFYYVWKQRCNVIYDQVSDKKPKLRGVDIDRFLKEKRMLVSALVYIVGESCETIEDLLYECLDIIGKPQIDGSLSVVLLTESDYVKFANNVIIVREQIHVINDAVVNANILVGNMFVVLKESLH